MQRLPKLLVELERDGRWADLRAWLSSLRAESPCELVDAAIARTDAQLGHYSSLERIPSASNPEWIQSYWQLAEAKHQRQKQDWPKAMAAAKAARRFAEAGGPSHLRAEAQFAEATAWVEQGYLYRGLDLFSEIGRNPGNSQFRRDLASVNEAWLLYDLGQVQSLAAMATRVPEGCRMRVELILAMLDDDQAAVNRIAAEKHRYANQIASEKLSILALFSEWSSQHPLNENWIGSALTGFSGPWAQALGQMWRGETVTLPAQLADWRDDLDISFAAFLSRVRSAPLEASRIFSERITPLLESHRIRPALIEGHSPWQQRIQRQLGRQAEARPLHLIVDRAQQTVRWNGKSLSLRKSPISLRCMVILARPQGSRVSKEELHRQLTGTRYVPHLHDSRLHKVLGRLSDRLEADLGLRAWNLPGDNSVALLETIELV